MVYFGRNERSSLQPSESRWPHRRSMRWGFVLVSNGALPRGSKLWAQSLLQDSTLEADSERQQTKVEISDPPRLCYVTYFRMWNLLFYEYSSPSLYCATRLREHGHEGLFQLALNRFFQNTKSSNLQLWFLGRRARRGKNQEGESRTTRFPNSAMLLLVDNECLSAAPPKTYRY